jgi:O-antigen ligase
MFSMTMIVGIAATIARTGSRGAFLGLVILLLVYLLSLKGASVIGRIMVIAILFGGLTLTAPDGYWKQMNTITDAQDDYNWDADMGRRKLAIRGIGYMMRFPIFGLGIENFGRAEGTISERALKWTPDQPGIKWSVAHNSYLQAGAELGIGGFILFISLVLGIIIHPYRLRPKIPKSWGEGDWEERFMKESLFFIPLAGLGFAIPGFFVSFAYNDPLYVIAALAGGLVSCVKLRLQGSARPSGLARPQAPRRRVMTRGAAFQPPRARLANPADSAASSRADFPGSSTTT